MTDLTLIPILGDQLSLSISALDGMAPEHCVLLMMEVDQETRYVRHHKAKLAYILSAMRHHAEALRDRGWAVDYVRLDDQDNNGSFSAELARAMIPAPFASPRRASGGCATCWKTGRISSACR